MTIRKLNNALALSDVQVRHKNLVTIELFKVGEALDGDDDDVASAPPNDHFMT